MRCGGKLKRAIQGFTPDNEWPPTVGLSRCVAGASCSWRRR
jgi:hypothetical protein